MAAALSTCVLWPQCSVIIIFSLAPSGSPGPAKLYLATAGVILGWCPAAPRYPPLSPL